MDPSMENPVPAAALQAASACSGSRNSLLLIGNDSGLQHSRRLLLERAGFTVVSLNSRQASAGESPEVCCLALICRSVGHRDALFIAHLLHAEQPQLPILRFATSGEAPSADFIALRRESATPPVLLAEVGRLLLIRQGA